LKEKIQTAYGTVTLEVRALEGSRIYVARKRHVFPAGTKTRGGEVLKKPFVLPRGAVLVPVWDDFEGCKPERFHRIFAGGIYEALRGTVHAVWKYGLQKKRGELQILRDISDRLATDLAVLMEGKSASSRELARVQLDLAAIATELGRPVGQMKAEAAAKVETAATLEVEHPSGTRSKNIPATAQRVKAAKIRVDRRHDQIRRIGPRVQFHEQVLAQTIGQLFDDLGSLRRLLQGERIQIARALSPDVHRIFCRRADFALERTLPRLDAAPFLKTADMIRYDLGMVKRAKGKKFALAAIDRILADIRLKEAQRAFENRVILPLAIDEDMKIVTEADFRHTRARLENFKQRFVSEIDDTGFIRPVKGRVIEAIDTILNEELGLGIEPDAERLKGRLKTISNML
jgi:hypothetical protein